MWRRPTVQERRFLWFVYGGGLACAGVILCGVFAQSMILAFVATLFSILLFILWPRFHRSIARAGFAFVASKRFLICPKCAYDLSGRAKDPFCPECGMVISRELLEFIWSDRYGFPRDATTSKPPFPIIQSPGVDGP